MRLINGNFHLQHNLVVPLHRVKMVDNTKFATCIIHSTQAHENIEGSPIMISKKQGDVPDLLRGDLDKRVVNTLELGFKDTLSKLLAKEAVDLLWNHAIKGLGG
jgi:hypothetical protein